MKRTTLSVTVALSLLLPQNSAHLGAQRAPARSGPPADASLDGTWSFATLTPLERPAEFAARASISLDEASKYAKAAIERNNADRRNVSRDVDVALAYNDAWYDRGIHMSVLNGQARTSLIVDPPDGRLPALTPAAAQRQAARAQDRRDHPADGPESRSLGERCLTFNAGPPVLPGPYNNNLQISVFDNYVVLLNEMIHDARIIPTDGRTHLPAQIRRFQGDSVGHWEGKTLVVDTTNFTGQTNFRGATDHLHLVERFSRADAQTMLYEFTVEDPTSFTRPWKVQLPMTATTDQIYEYACHEGNEALAGILRGARFEEKEKTGK
jgi:hypothetical protein